MTLLARTLLLIAIAVAPSLALQSWSGFEKYRDLEGSLRGEALTRTRELQADLGRLTGGVEELLISLSEAPAVRGGDPGACAGYVTAVARRLPEYMVLGVKDAAGAVLCNSNGAQPGEFREASRAYFQRALATDGFAVGDLVTGASTHRPGIHFALPFRRADGGPGGVVFASVDQRRLAALVGSALPPSGALAFVVDPSGVVVAGWADEHAMTSGWVGKPLPGGLRDALAVDAPSLVLAAGPDGSSRLFGTVPRDARLGGLVVAVGLDRASALASLRHATRDSLASIALGAALALLAGFVGGHRLIVDPLTRVSAAANRVARGDLRARAALGRAVQEVGELGSAFDRMSVALLEREAARDAAEAARRAIDGRYRLLFEAIEVGFCVIELRFERGRAVDYRFVEVNPAFEEQTRITDACGRWVSELFPVVEAYWVELYEAVALTGRATRLERRSESLGRWFDVHAFKVEGEGARVAILFSDITARRRAEAELSSLNDDLERRVSRAVEERSRVEAALRQSQKMEAIGQLTGGIAHDFNNLLTGITGSLDIVKRRIAQGRAGEIERYIGVATSSAGRAAALTHRLLAFSRRQDLAPKVVDGNALVRGMTELLHRTLGERVVLRTELAPDLRSTWCDPHQLENAILNLCINARDAMPDGGKLRIATRNAQVAGADGREVARVVFSVTDDGTGMPPEVIEKIFEPFFTTKPAGKGTGLGLAMVHGFASQSGGEIRVESRVGVGTAISIALPHREGGEAGTGPSPEAAIPSAGPGETVLVIDDEATVRGVVVDMLSELGYATVEAHDGCSGLAVLRSASRLDVLITDVGLPGPMSGKQLADQARRTRPGLGVVYMTGQGGDLRLDGSERLILKPFEMADIASKVRSAIAAV